MKKLMLSALVVLSSILATASGAVARDEAKEALQGVWQAKSVEVNGKFDTEEAVKGLRFTFKGDTLIMRGSVFGKDISREQAYSIDATESPKQLDVNGEKDADAILGIYELEGNELAVCLRRRGSGRARPTEFVSKGPDVLIVVFQRFASAADEDDKKALQGVWQASSIKVDGKAEAEEAVKGLRFTFEGDKLVISGPVDALGVDKERTFTLDASKSPKELDLRVLVPRSRPQEGQVKLANPPKEPFLKGPIVADFIRGIYEIKGNTLKVFLPHRSFGTIRPAKFPTGTREGILIVFERVAAAAEDSDKRALQGVWQAKSIEVDGKFDTEEAVKGMRFTFKGDWVLMRGSVLGKDISGVHAYAVNAARSPKLLAIMGSNEANEILGIYEIKGTELRVCLRRNGSGQRSPAEFASKGPNDFLIVFQRVGVAPEEDDKKDLQAPAPPVPHSEPKGVAAEEDDKKALKGVWQAKSVEFQGNASPEDKFKTLRFTFKEDLLLFRGDRMGENQDIYIYSIDATKSPKQLDLMKLKDTREGVAIYELKGDELKVCLLREGSNEGRPTEFTTKKGSDRVLIVFQKKR